MYYVTPRVGSVAGGTRVTIIGKGESSIAATILKIKVCVQGELETANQIACHMFITQPLITAKYYHQHGLCDQNFSQIIVKNFTVKDLFNNYNQNWKGIIKLLNNSLKDL